MLDAAVEWSRETLKADSKLTDSDFKTMQLFQVPKIITASEAASYGIVTAVVEPKIKAAHRPLVQM